MLITLHIFVSVNYKYTILSTEVVRFRTPLLSQTESVLHVPYSSEYRRRVPNSTGSSVSVSLALCHVLTDYSGDFAAGVS